MNEEQLKIILKVLKESFTEEQKEHIISYLFIHELKDDFDTAMTKLYAINTVYNVLN